MAVCSSVTNDVDFLGMLGLPVFDLGFAELSDLGKHVNAAEQDVDMLGPKHELPLLCLDEAVFHRMRDANDRHRVRRCGQLL